MTENNQCVSCYAPLINNVGISRKKKEEFFGSSRRKALMGKLNLNLAVLRIFKYSIKIGEVSTGGVPSGRHKGLTFFVSRSPNLSILKRALVEMPKRISKIGPVTSSLQRKRNINGTLWFRVFRISRKAKRTARTPAKLKLRIGIRIKVHCRDLRVEVIHKYSPGSAERGGREKDERGETNEDLGFLPSSSCASWAGSA